MNKFKLMLAMLVAATMISCSGNQTSKSSSKQTASECPQDSCCNSKKCKKMAKFEKKYTNADYYTDGKFNDDVALKAMTEMIEFYGLPMTDFLKKNIWVTDFGMGDFENAGMAGVFWVNDKEHGYFAHAIYLLPDQMIPEHAHVKTDMPAKFESWMVDKGWAYNFNEVDAETPNPPKIAESQASTVRSKNFVIQNVGDILHLKKSETFHFLRAGDEGAIVTEWASYHDGAGLRFSNPKAK